MKTKVWITPAAVRVLQDSALLLAKLRALPPISGGLANRSTFSFQNVHHPEIALGLFLNF